MKSTADKVKSNSRKRQRLWTDFHKMATSESTLSLLWQEMITNLGIDGIEDPLLEQSLYNEVHQRIVKDYFKEGAEFTGPVTKAKIENISSDELNILRYACGYAACKLLKRYEKKPGEITQQYVNCPGEMAVEGEGDDVLAYTKVWLDKINRGGFSPL